MVTMVTIVTNLVMVVYWIHVKEKMVSVQTDTSGCKPRRQLGQMKKCGKDINAMFYLFFIQDEVTYQFINKDIRAI